MIRTAKTDQFNEALDLLDRAHKIVEKLDGDVAGRLHVARTALEDSMAREAMLAVRKDWNERPQAAVSG